METSLTSTVVAARRSAAPVDPAESGPNGNCRNKPDCSHDRAPAPRACAHGRRMVFLAGVIWFAIASVLCGLAPSAGALIAARALQGVGAALLTPGSLAIIESSFKPDDRGKAIGAWSGSAGVGTAIGPFLAGWLIQVVSWRLIFAINLPIAALVIAVAWKHVPETRDTAETGPVDILGGALVTLGLVGLTYGLIDGPTAGWNRPGPLGALIAGLILLIHAVQLGECGHLRGLCGARRRAVPAPHPARAGLRVHGAQGGHLAAAGDGDHAAAVRAFRCPGGADRPAAPDDGTPRLSPLAFACLAAPSLPSQSGTRAT
jgi:Major Facilitator Superfamily